MSYAEPWWFTALLVIAAIIILVVGLAQANTDDPPEPDLPDNCPDWNWPQ